MTNGIKEQVDAATNFLKGLASPHRLLILCQLVESEKSVGALIEATGLAQTSMSQHLLKLRKEGIVTYRREHRTLHYRITHAAVQDVIGVLHKHFCNERDQP